MIMHRWLVSLLLHQALALSQQHSIALIHDDSIDFQHPTESAELWIKAIVDSFSVDVIYASPKTDLSERLTSHSRDFSEPFELRELFLDQFLRISDDFIIISQCETFEALSRQLRIVTSQPNIFFLDFLICRPLRRLDVFHLEAFRLDVVHFLSFDFAVLVQIDT